MITSDKLIMEKRRVYLCVGIIGSVIILLGLTVFLIIYFSSNDDLQLVKAGPKLVIDHDGGSDDAMAIFLALLYEKYFDGPTIVGLTTTHGNVEEPQVSVNTQRILGIANRRDVPYYRGTNNSLLHTHPSDYFFGRDGLGDLPNVTYKHFPPEPSHAVTALIELSKKYKGELIVMAMGALTNIAVAIRLDPHFISRLSVLYVAAGNIYSPSHLEPEFNALIDVEGYHVVAENSIQDKVVFIPFSPLLDRHNISMDWRANVLGAIKTKIMQSQNEFDHKIIDSLPTWSYLDPKAMAMVLNTNLIEELQCSKNSIILCGHKRGINANEFVDCNNSTARIAFPKAEDGFKTFLYDVFSAELSRA